MAQDEFVDTDLLEDETKDVPSYEARSSNLRTKFTSKEEEARKKLDEIRQQMEELERQRLENAELTRRLEEFDRNKSELQHQLARTIASLEKHELDIGKQLSTVSSVRKSLLDDAGKLEDIREETWTNEDVRSHLSDANETLEEARNNLSRGRQQLVFLENIEIEVPGDNAREHPREVMDSASFRQELIRGLAWSLPLSISVLILAVIALLKG